MDSLRARVILYGRKRNSSVAFRNDDTYKPGLYVSGTSDHFGHVSNPAQILQILPQQVSSARFHTVQNETSCSQLSLVILWLRA